jgi:hypothetical protein
MANEVEPGPEREALLQLLQLAYHWDRLVAYNIDKNSKENKGHANTRVRYAGLFGRHFDYPKGQFSGIVARPEYKAASLTTRALSSRPKRTLAIHGSVSAFPARLFMQDKLVREPLVREYFRAA